MRFLTFIFYCNAYYNLLNYSKFNFPLYTSTAERMYKTILIMNFKTKKQNISLQQQYNYNHIQKIYNPSSSIFKKFVLDCHFTTKVFKQNKSIDCYLNVSMYYKIECPFAF